jgi:hypothetical protein
MLRVVVVRSRTGRVGERANSKPKPNANPSAIRKVIIFCRYCKVVLTLDFEVLIELELINPHIKVTASPMTITLRSRNRAMGMSLCFLVILLHVRRLLYGNEAVTF